MADVIPTADDDRAQLILVIGLTIALVLVALVVILNSMIYTENLATRGVDVGTNDVIDFRSSVIVTGAEIIEHRNREGHTEYENGNDGVEPAVEGSIARHLLYLHDHHIEDAKIVRAEIVGTTEGRSLVQDDENRQFTSENGDSDWTLVDDTERTRNSTITVEYDELEEARTDLTGIPPFDMEDTFHIVVEDENDEEWIVYIYDELDLSDTEIDIAVQRPGDDIEHVCGLEESEIDGDYATVDFADGTVEGVPCEDDDLGLVWGEGLDESYEIEFVNGDRATGTYRMVVEGDDSNLETTNFHAPDPDADSPYYMPAVYGVTVELNYQNVDLTYEETVEIAPGTPDDTDV